MILQQDESRPVPDESQLISQFARGNGSVFVGAGLSMGANLPGWAELIGDLAGIVQSPAHSSFPDIAQYYVNLHDRPALERYILEKLKRPECSPTEVHDALIKLPVPRIFTTNFDDLIEEAFRKQGVVPVPVPVSNDQHLALMDNVKKSIIKLHGDLRSPELLVIASKDYDDYFTNRPGMANLLGMDIHSRTVLFLGYSFSDADLRAILSRAKRIEGRDRRNLFAVQFNPTSLEIKELDRLGVTVIALKEESRNYNQALKEWLENFVRRVRESSELQPFTRQLFTIDFINSSLRPRRGYFPFCASDLSRVLAGLRSRYPLIAIKGFAGVGKTSLAIEASRSCSVKRSEAKPASVIFEYVVWISAKDKPDQKRWLNDVLDAIAITTDNPVITRRPFEEPQNKAEEVEKLLRSYKVLVIIDNFETIEDPELVEWLERLPEPSKAIITSRSRPEQIAALTVNLVGLDNEEATRLLREHAARVGLRFTPKLDVILGDLIGVTHRNPLAMRQAFGLAEGNLSSLEQIVLELKELDRGPDKILEAVFSVSWKRLSDSARQILLVPPLFVGVNSIHKNVLRAATELPSSEFRQGLEQCLRFGLLKEDHDPQRYFMHPTTRTCTRKELDEQPGWEQEAKQRCTEYFLKFVEKRVKRSRPKPQYWNALVDKDKLGKLEFEWQGIQQAMAWADEDGSDKNNLVKFVMLLVHYMDSQFMNRERLEYVRKAVAALDSMGHKEEEALLRIDALGWTYVEVLELDKAQDEINEGLKIAQGKDLQALGHAWLARVSVERKGDRKDFKLAGELIEKAKALASKCRPWIKFRVNMAAGDIALKQGDQAAKALDHYQKAAQEADHYRGEGGGYQIGPRVGLAYLGLKRIEEAEQKFNELMGNLEKIPIGKLYAEYGLALVARERGKLAEAQVMLNDVKAQLSRHTSKRSNLLLRLIQEQESRMQGSQTAEDPGRA